MIVAFLRKRFAKQVAMVCLLTMAFELLFPVASMALTSGPSQPEVQSFEPVGTTDMVDMFSGDFNYNIPLLDVEGYPVNIAYHSGITMEQEASWVGLGWNINPGEINHVVRGVSDDYKGDQIKKELQIEDEKDGRFGVFTGAEMGGMNLDASAKEAMKELNKIFGSTQLDFGINISNYNGVSASIGQSNTFRIPKTSIGLNMGMTVSTDNGADIDYGVSMGFSVAARYGIGGSVSFNGAMNSNEGVQYSSYGASIAKLSANNTKIPIGLQNYVPVITNASSVLSAFYQLKIGGEVYMFYPFGGANYDMHTMHIENDGSRSAYGYMNLDKATDEDIVDFSREKDGRISKKTRFLPMCNMTYDIYNVNGQGTGGCFRPYRNDIGTVYDPLTEASSKKSSYLGEIGFGDVFEAGLDLKLAFTQSKSGPWKAHTKAFSSKSLGKLYEPFYFKQAGELTESNTAMEALVNNNDVIGYGKTADLLTDQNSVMENSPRVARSNLMYFLTAGEANYSQISLMPKLLDYSGMDGFKVPNAQPASIERVGGYRQKNQMSEFTQVLPDGRRYIYGLPVMNNYQIDYEVSVAPSNTSNNRVTLPYNGNNPQAYDNAQLAQRYYSKTETPAYAHSYMLTAVISPDYSDLTGDGLSDDDLGTYTKFNYSRKETDYHWRAPYKNATAQYNKGIRSNCNDDKANFSMGSKEIWMLHSIESRNYVAEFFTSARKDGLGATDPAFSSNSNPGKSYKLDSIVLYNKKERFTDPANAVPIKTVVFHYDYSLCSNVDNYDASAHKGKLTLKAIFIKYGGSDVGYLSPYEFKYFNDATGNPTYNEAAKDCWGSYKPENGNSFNGTSTDNLTLNNIDFPYVNQNDPYNDLYAKAWNLKEINLPSGGTIKITYESDDYAYVQDKHAMEMFRVEGVGPTTDFVANNSLYQDMQDPYLYIYFRRKPSVEHSSNLWESYLDNAKLLQYTFDVELSPGQLNSCSGNPLTEMVKGYAEVIDVNACTGSGGSGYGYIKLAPKTPNQIPALANIGVKNASINPVSLAAINFARFYNKKALNPESEMLSPDGSDMINQLISSMGSFINFFENPLKTYLKKQKAKNFTLGKSFVRLVSQGLKKKGGGHRVKRLEFADTWEGVNNTAAYGSDYDYTIKDPQTGTTISSGVASYEPLIGGDENPCRSLMNTENAGNNSKFPPVDPIEIFQEAPLGESLYPPASVGYSKVTVTSIHKNEGASSQAINEYEFYTAKDFPVTVAYEDLEKVEEQKPKIYQLFHKKDIYKVAQGYALALNDMHGKSKKQTTWVQKNGDNKELVSYTSYEYFTNANGSLNNKVPCLTFESGSASPKKTMRTLGEETDFTADTREKSEITNFVNLQFSMNMFLAPPIPVDIPVVFPSLKKESKIFSSLVNTKVIQRYGIIKSVETYDKGAVIKVENEAFDPKTGQVLITKVNSQHSDYEYNVKYPAYWAYRGMGSAYENILFEESMPISQIVEDVLYVNTPNIDNYNIGDEVELDGKSYCAMSPISFSPPNLKFKGWVVDKKIPPAVEMVCSGSGCQPPGVDLWYTMNGQCYTLQQVQQIVYNLTHRMDISLSMPVPYERVVIRHENVHESWSAHDGNFPCIAKVGGNCDHTGDDSVFICRKLSSYQSVPIPYATPYITRVLFDQSYRVKAGTGSNTNPANFQDVPYEHGLYHVSMDVPATTLGQYSVSPSSQVVYQSPVGGAGVSSSLCPSRQINVVNQEVQTVGNSQLTRAAQPKSLAIKVIKIGASALNNTNIWPSNDYLVNGKIKIIRSGKRNQLTETVQEVTTLTNPIVNDILSENFTNVVNSSVKTFDDKALIPDDIAGNNATVYYNPFVNGECGNYRIKATYLAHKLRNYTSAFSDKQKGLYAVNSYWTFPATINGEFFLKMVPNALSTGWLKKDEVVAYSPYGIDLEVKDATGNVHANLTGYSHRLPIAVVSNANWNNAISENFEDFIELFGLSYFKFFQNGFKKSLYSQVNTVWAGTGAIGTDIQVINTQSHSGSYALNIINPIAINIPIGSANSPSNSLVPFYFRPGQKYIASCWQKVNANNPVPQQASLHIAAGTPVVHLLQKTPAIDGWVLYEAEINVPANATGNASIMINGTNTFLDDIRILPAISNMKSYVYDPVKRRLVAVLDENHMTTFFEYNDEGKLARVKKETEKGIITLKESRESLKNIFNQAVGGNVPYNYPASYANDPY